MKRLVRRAVRVSAGITVLAFVIWVSRAGATHGLLEHVSQGAVNGNGPHLYILAHVTDTLLSKASANPWEQDSVEVFLDQNNAKTSQYQPDDGQFRVNYENTQTFGGSATAARIVSATRVVPGGYDVELAITFGAIEPRVGTLIGFDFQVNNDELGNGVRSSVVTWNDPTGESFRNTSRFGVLKLVYQRAR